MIAAHLLGAGRHRLLTEAGVVLLVPRGAKPAELEAGVQTTTRGGRRRAVAADVRWRPAGDAPAVEICVIARDHVLGSIPDDERAEIGELALVAEYLEREARSGLALRAAELADGDAERQGQPLDRLLAERRAALPSARPVALRVDGRTRDAASVRWGDHCATWADLASAGVGVTVYGAGHEGTPELVTER